MRKLILLFSIVVLGLSCNVPTQSLASSETRSTASPAPPTEPATSASEMNPTPTETEAGAATPSKTSPATDTLTATPSDTPTATGTATPAGTPTLQAATATSIAKTACLYGPNPAYLYMWGLEKGDTAQINGRDYGGSWLWVQPTGTKLYCWIWAPAVTVSVPIQGLPYVNPPLPTNPRVAPPTGVSASRSANTVTIRWNAAPPAVQLAYLIEATICGKGGLMDVVYSTTGLSYTLNDGRTCSQHSYGQVRVLNKLGYSTPVKVPWP